jgi:deoxyribodipyrimidine photolyase-related protein
MSKCRLIFHDQLSFNLASLKQVDVDKDIIVLIENKNDFNEVPHHKKKIAFLLSAQRHFKLECEQQNFSLLYFYLDDPVNQHNYKKQIQEILLQNTQITEVVVTKPSQYTLFKEVESWSSDLSVPLKILEDDRFLCPESVFNEWAQDRATLVMEYFYRMLRRRHGILMNEDQPEGGQWNFDQLNRKKPNLKQQIPTTYRSKPDAITKDVLNCVENYFPDHFGDLHPFHFAVTRSDALLALKQFIQERLSLFGDYQDAMIQGEPWMFHSHLSFYLNCGLLLPLECIEAAVEAYHRGAAPINSVEGFVRQILGWREFVRGIYWYKMPQYKSKNFFNAKRHLPEFYWTGKTKLNCIAQCVKETKENAYAHHIQRLMVLGNFALLTGIHPDEVNDWYLAVYADAYQWVELPNVTGMILFADGGYLASKPYASGGAYINRMSNYCKGCHYSVSKKEGGQACPFNYLYWDFLSRNRPLLKKNHRMAMMYHTFDKMTPEKKHAIASDATTFIQSLSSNE